MAKMIVNPEPNLGSSGNGSASLLKRWNILFYLVLLIAVVLVIIRIVLSNMHSTSSFIMSASEPEEAAEPESAFLPEPTELPNPTVAELEPGEVTDKSIILSDKFLGEVELSYPVRVHPQSSNIIRLSISRPDFLASSVPASFQIVEIDRDEINKDLSLYGDLHTDRSTILIDDKMKVEISAQTFGIEPHFPSIQNINLKDPDAVTNWAWTITAPQAQGVHILNFKVFVDEESQSPSWFGAYQLEVSAPASSPQNTSISSSESTTQASFLDTSAFNSINQLIDLLTIFSTIAAGVIAIKRRHVKRRVALMEIIQQHGPANEIDETELNDRISKLESIKWWQFWK
jgi:hypothetical protein